MAPMAGAFLIFAPLAVGAITVYMAESTKPRHWRYWVSAPFAANSLMVFAAMVIAVEGIICAVLILPMFWVIGAIGGVSMGLFCRRSQKRKRAVLGFAALPFLVDQVWSVLLHTPNIRPSELGHAWMYRIGVPLPEAGITRRTPEGLVRDVTMGKAIHFEQVSSEWEAQRHVRWTYRFHPNSFPPQALDDHVTIGGHHFDLIDTDYTLTPIDSKRTQLRIRMGYRVSTQFNWYADRIASWLIGDFADVVLAFYARRATAAKDRPSGDNP
jgi:hypothetical protein